MKISYWFDNARSKSLPQSIIPAILALSLAWHKEDFSIRLGLLAIVGVMLGHLPLNLFDDYFDYKNKKADYRESLEHKGIRARIAKSPYLVSGEVSLQKLLFVCCVFAGLALICGLIIFIFRGEIILYLALAAAIIGLSYSGKPLKLGYRGFGEIIIGLMFGPMLMTGVYVASCGSLDWSTLLISIPVGMLVMNIVYTHSIMDFEADKNANKMTFAVLLNNKTAMIVVLALLIFMSYLLVVLGVILSYLSPYYLFVLFTLPMACGLVFLMIEFVRDQKKTFTPKWWMGPMGDWKHLQDIGIDWFMIRWLLARNTLSFFCLILIFVNIFV